MAYLINCDAWSDMAATSPFVMRIINATLTSSLSPNNPNNNKGSSTFPVAWPLVYHNSSSLKRVLSC